MGIEELEKNLNSDFNDQEITTLAKENKQKQLAQLTKRLKTLEDSISAVMKRFVQHCVTSLYWLIDQMNEKKNAKQANGTKDDKEADEDEEEMNDDALMSEQFVVKNEDKEKEKLALLKAKNASTDKYIFDIINARMVEICRRFDEYISFEDLDQVALQKEVKHELNQQIIDSFENIRQI